MREPEYVRQGIARLMILHALQAARAAYAALLHALAPHVSDLDYAYGFIPEQFTEVRRIWEGLGLRVERYAYVLEHPGAPAPAVDVPDGYRLQHVQASDGAVLAAFCGVLNLGFAGYPQRVDATPAGLAQDITGPYGLTDGTLLLWCEGRPVGTARVERDDAPGAASIGAVAVDPQYRGRGLGRLLVREALRVAAGHGLRPVHLSVSATNEAAIQLYVGEGFRKSRVMVCYRWEPGVLIGVK
jgi:mycothiol synthase